MGIFYRRTLPSPAIELASYEGKQLFSEAFGEGTMNGFFNLISYYQTQSEPSYCGPATLATVLNALSIDPGRKWKGAWRWFDDIMFVGSKPNIKTEGVTFAEVAQLAYHNGARVLPFRTDECNLDSFRRDVISCSSFEGCHIIASYHRSVLKQSGSGHFSPIGGYHAGGDMALILDVARYKYPPHWIPLSLLWDAMNTVDDATGRPRGELAGSEPLIEMKCCEGAVVDVQSEAGDQVNGEKIRPDAAEPSFKTVSAGLTDAEESESCQKALLSCSQISQSLIIGTVTWILQNEKAT